MPADKNYYFKTDWEVRPVDSADLDHLVRVIGKLNCLLYTQGSHRTAEGLFAVWFVLRVPAQGVLAQFVADAGERLGLTDWQPTNAREFSGAPFVGSRIGGFVEAAQIYGKANATLRRRGGTPG